MEFVLRTDAAPRPIGLGWAIALSGALGILAIRATESPGDALSFVRILVSAFAIGTFFFVRRFSPVKGLLLAMAIEIAAGLVLFALIDMPFLKTHAPQIVSATISSVQQLEHSARAATLANL